MGNGPSHLTNLVAVYQGAQTVSLDEKFRFSLPKVFQRVFFAAPDKEQYCMAHDVTHQRIVIISRKLLSEIFGQAILRDISPLIERYDPDSSSRQTVPHIHRRILNINPGEVIIAGHYDYMALYSQSGWDQYLEKIKALQPAHQATHEIR